MEREVDPLLIEPDYAKQHRMFQFRGTAQVLGRYDTGADPKPWFDLLRYVVNFMARASDPTLDRPGDAVAGGAFGRRSEWHTDLTGKRLD